MKKYEQVMQNQSVVSLTVLTPLKLQREKKSLKIFTHIWSSTISNRLEIPIGGPLTPLHPPPPHTLDVRQLILSGPGFFGPEEGGWKVPRGRGEGGKEKGGCWLENRYCNLGQGLQMYTSYNLKNSGKSKLHHSLPQHSHPLPSSSAVRVEASALRQSKLLSFEI